MEAVKRPDEIEVNNGFLEYDYKRSVDVPIGTVVFFKGECEHKVLCVSDLFDSTCEECECNKNIYGECLKMRCREEVRADKTNVMFVSYIELPDEELKRGIEIAKSFGYLPESE